MVFANDDGTQKGRDERYGEHSANGISWPMSKDCSTEGEQKTESNQNDGHTERQINADTAEK